MRPRVNHRRPNVMLQPLLSPNWFWVRMLVQPFESFAEPFSLKNVTCKSLVRNRSSMPFEIRRTNQAEETNRSVQFHKSFTNHPRLGNSPGSKPDWIVFFPFVSFSLKITHCSAAFGRTVSKDTGLHTRRGSHGQTTRAQTSCWSRKLSRHSFSASVFTILRDQI